MARFNYVELPVSEIGAAKEFYERAFRWSMTAFRPTYAATLTGDTDIGLQADPSEATTAPLPVIEIEDLEATLAAVQAAGGKIARPIFAFSRRAAVSFPRSERKRGCGGEERLIHCERRMSSKPFGTAAIRV